MRNEILLNGFSFNAIQATNPWPTDGDIETVNEASHDVSIPFIAGTAGSTVIVLLIALFIGLLVRRKRKRR